MTHLTAREIEELSEAASKATPGPTAMNDRERAEALINDLRGSGKVNEMFKRIAAHDRETRRRALSEAIDIVCVYCASGDEVVDDPDGEESYWHQLPGEGYIECPASALYEHVKPVTPNTAAHQNTTREEREG